MSNEIGRPGGKGPRLHGDRMFDRMHPYVEAPGLSLVLYLDKNQRQLPESFSSLATFEGADEVILCLDGQRGRVMPPQGFSDHPNGFTLRSAGLGAPLAIDRALRIANSPVVCVILTAAPLPTTSTWIHEALTLFEAHPQLGILGTGRGTLEWGDLCISAKSLKRFGLPAPPIHPVTGRPFTFVETVEGGAFFISRKLYEKVGGWDLLLSDPGEIDTGFEYEMGLRMWAEGYEVALFAPDPYSTLPDEFSTRDAGEYRRYIAKKFESQKEIIQERLRDSEILFNRRARQGRPGCHGENGDGADEVESRAPSSVPAAADESDTEDTQGDRSAVDVPDVDGSAMGDSAEGGVAADGSMEDGATEDDSAEVGVAPDDSPVDDSPVDDSPVDESHVDDSPVDESHVDESHVDNARSTELDGEIETAVDSDEFLDAAAIFESEGELGTSHVPDPLNGSTEETFGIGIGLSHEDDEDQDDRDPTHDGEEGILVSRELKLVVSHEVDELSRPRFRAAFAPLPRRHKARIAQPTSQSLISWGLACHRRGDHERAERMYKEALEIEPESADAHNNLGLIQKQNKEFYLAIKHIQLAVKFDPGTLTYRTNLGNTLRQMGFSKLAVRVYKKALKIHPNSVTCLINLCESLRAMKRMNSARHLLEEAIWRLPKRPEIPHHLGLIHMLIGNLEESEMYLRQSLELSKQYAPACHTLGVLLHRRGRLEEAIEMLRMAIVRKGVMMWSQWQLSQCLLLCGDYVEGFKLYGVRRNMAVESALEQDPPPVPWAGEFLGDRNLLLSWDGDSAELILMLRFITEVVRRGGQIHLQGPADLDKLIPKAPNLHYLNQRAGLPKVDVVCSVSWLPSLLKVRQDSLSGQEPYLISPSLDFDWPGSTGSDRKRIGISWRPPRMESYEIGEWPTLEDLVTVLDRPDVDLYLIDSGYTEPLPARPSGGALIDVRPFMVSVPQIGASLAEVDWVVSTPTTVAHLAGALGHEVWVLLPPVPGWCWGQDGDRTCWYPTARLFRSSADVDSRLEQIRQALEERLTIP